MTHTNGVNGTHVLGEVEMTASEMRDLVARYRTALVALLALIKRDGGWMEHRDQLLLKEVQRLLDGAA